MNPELNSLIISLVDVETTKLTGVWRKTEQTALGERASRGQVDQSTATGFAIGTACLAVGRQAADHMIGELKRILILSESPLSASDEAHILGVYGGWVVYLHGCADQTVGEFLSRNGVQRDHLIELLQTRATAQADELNHNARLILMEVKHAIRNSNTMNQPTFILQNSPNARVNINSTDSSTNIAAIEAAPLFEKLRQAVTAQYQDEAYRLRVLAAVERIEKGQNKGVMLGAYNDFMQLVANHVQAFAYFLPALTDLVARALN